MAEARPLGSLPAALACDTSLYACDRDRSNTAATSATPPARYSIATDSSSFASTTNRGRTTHEHVGQC